MTHRVKLGISSCLLGNKVRYNGGDKLDLYLRDDLGRFVEWVAVCPEVEMGLTVPREPMILVGDESSHRLIAEMTQMDYTDQMKNWAKEKLTMLLSMKLHGFVFKSKSPSCGIRALKVSRLSGITYEQGVSIFASEFMKRFPHIPVEDEIRLADANYRDQFLMQALLVKNQEIG
ncbi:MAG TPA: DUF523 domain-containing protein [Dissulfurispiraceae bacterium]|nr:DUF523 domain-containing protein [Dissulfurispiraceae bacterium]